MLFNKALLAASVLGTAGQPFEQPPGDVVVVKADEAIVYGWPLVPDSYIESAQLRDMAAWLASARRDEGIATGREQSRDAGGVVLIEKRMTACFVDPGLQG
jgi:hypothetical protein